MRPGKEMRNWKTSVSHLPWCALERHQLMVVMCAWDEGSSRRKEGVGNEGEDRWIAFYFISLKETAWKSGEPLKRLEMWTLQLFAESGPRSYVTCICTSTGSHSRCVHIPHLSVRVDGSSIELCCVGATSQFVGSFFFERTFTPTEQETTRKYMKNTYFDGESYGIAMTEYIWERLNWTEGKLGQFGHFL